MLTEVQQVLDQGGWVLWALIFLGIGLYSILASTWLGLLKVKHELGQYQFQDDDHRFTIREFTAFGLDRLAWVERRLPFIGVLAGAAPLAGLLGTVSGMLITFSGLATSTAAAPIDKISVGISKALITTQAGLLIAIPAAFLLALLRKKTEATQATLQQKLHRSLINSH